MSLARLRLHHGQRSADAGPRSLDVAGSDPPSRHASIGIGQDGYVHPHPPLRRGVAPSQRSFQEGVKSAASKRMGDLFDRLAVGRTATSSRTQLAEELSPREVSGAQIVRSIIGGIE